MSRDWLEGSAAPTAYSICYVNAFQTQPDERGVQRPDATRAGPADLVLSSLAQDPSWTGEYLIDFSTAERRARAADWVAPMVQTCKDKGFDAVEFDECDSYTAGYGDEVIVIEYCAAGFERACTGCENQLSIVRRDVEVSTPDDAGYVLDGC